MSYVTFEIENGALYINRKAKRENPLLEDENDSHYEEPVYGSNILEFDEVDWYEKTFIIYY